MIFASCPGPSTPQPGALEIARKKKPGWSGRDDREERKSLPLDRKNPPFAQTAKDGAPSSSVGW